MLKDGWIRSQPCDGKLIDIALEGSLVQQVTRYVVEPQALPEIMEFLCRLHRSSCSPVPHVVSDVCCPATILLLKPLIRHPPVLPRPQGASFQSEPRSRPGRMRDAA